MTKDGASGKRRRPDEAAQPAPKRAPALLSWMRHASLIEEDTPGVDSLAPELDERLLTSLSDGGVSRLFPVQAAVWTALRGGSFDARDICVNAPTGSGKTLAYVLPVVSALRHRVVCRLRALVVLPTHDLALQVGAVFAPLCQAVGLSMAVVSGKGALQPEADALVQRLGAPQPADEQPPELASRVDILVATPGRLVAHVQSTPGFSLAHLRWLVVDEMDRLLRQSYQDWLAVVLASTAAAPRSGSCWGSGHDGHGAAGRRFRGGMLGDRVATPRLVKVVVSATVTRDPSKLEQLQLHSPLLLSATPSDERCQFPAQLELFRTVVPADQKPFALIALLQSVRDSTVLVFTASVSSTNKLYTMLASLGHAVVGTCVEYSSMHSHQQRSEALASFRARKATVLVASDAATRGLDVEGIDVVISYDTPVYLKTYVHRVGRTARAGRPGRAYTLLRPEEVHHFKRMLKKAGDHAVNTHKVPAQELHELRARHAAVCAPLLDEEEAPS